MRRAWPSWAPRAGYSPPSCSFPPARGRHGCCTISFVPPEGASAMDSASLIVPTVIESGTRGERAYDLFSRLLRERIVLVNGPIEDQLASLIVAELLFLASESSERPINMYISSPGGVITAGMAIYDTMRSLRSPISTTCVGLSPTFPTLFPLAGDPRQPFPLPHAQTPPPH